MLDDDDQRHRRVNGRDVLAAWIVAAAFLLVMFACSVLQDGPYTLADLKPTGQVVSLGR